MEKSIIFRTFLVLIVIAVDSSNVSVVECSSESADQSYLVPEPTARVFLFSLERGPLLPIADTPNSDVVLTKEPGYFQAYMFECNASFPIQWSYMGEGAPLITADVGRSFRNFFDPATYTYHATMIMFTLEEQNTGRYVCRGIEPQHNRISIYFHLYVPGKDILLSTDEKTVQVGPHKQQFTIPCGASDPTSVVNLYKGNHKGSYVRLDTNSSIIYNPRKGFKVHHLGLADPYGKYLCVAQSSKRRVRITVTPKGDRLKRDLTYQDPEALSELPLLYKPPRPLEFSYDQRYHRMLCCSASGHAPKLTYAGCTSIVDCEIKSACFRAGKCEARDEPPSSYNKYVGLDPRGCTGHSLRDEAGGDQGLFLCQDSSNSALTEYQPFQLMRGNLYMSFEEAPRAELIMTLNRGTNEPILVGSETEFRCNTSKFFFGFGIRWAYERSGGELEFVPDEHVVKDAFFLSAHRRHSVLRIPSPNIKSIVCIAPVWNSPTEWRILHLPISISREFRPSPFAPLSAPAATVAADPALHYDVPPSPTVGFSLTQTYTEPSITVVEDNRLKLHRRILPVRGEKKQEKTKSAPVWQQLLSTPRPPPPSKPPASSPQLYARSREESGRRFPVLLENPRTEQDSVRYAAPPVVEEPVEPSLGYAIPVLEEPTGPNMQYAAPVLKDQAEYNVEFSGNSALKELVESEQRRLTASLEDTTVAEKESYAASPSNDPSQLRREHYYEAPLEEDGMFESLGLAADDEHVESGGELRKHLRGEDDAESIHRHYYETLDDVLFGHGGGARDEEMGRRMAEFAQVSPEEGMGMFNSTFDLISSIL